MRCLYKADSATHKSRQRASWSPVTSVTCIVLAMGSISAFEAGNGDDQASLEKLREAKDKAEAEVQAIRAKLHSAVRKGKAIEAGKVELLTRVQELNKVRIHCQTVFVNTGLG